MQYNVIGLMSGSSLDGLDIAFVHFEEIAGKWTFEILETACIPYTAEWKKKLRPGQPLGKRLSAASHSLWSLDW